MTQPPSADHDSRDSAQLLELRANLRMSIHGLRNLLATQLAILRQLSQCMEGSERAWTMVRDLEQTCEDLTGIIQGIEAARSGRVDATREPAPERTHPPKPAPIEPGVAGNPKRILIVDDNVEAALSLASMLRFEGFETLTAHDGARAAQLVQSERPSFVVLDLEMPIMDGYEAARQIRIGQGNTDCRLIAITGHTDREDRERAIAAGFQAYLTKPIDPDALLRLFASVPSTQADADPLGSQ